jgi:predicted TIM-barrel fold metal-dependent hydrolase
VPSPLVGQGTKTGVALAALVHTSHIMLGSDFPFGETKPVGLLASARKIPEKARQAMLGANAARLLGVEI